MTIRNFGHHSFITWTEKDLRKERLYIMDDYDYECQTCHHRITMPFDRFNPPYICPKCGNALSFLSKEIIEENERINAKEKK